MMWLLCVTVHEYSLFQLCPLSQWEPAGAPVPATVKRSNRFPNFFYPLFTKRPVTPLATFSQPTHPPKPHGPNLTLPGCYDLHGGQCFYHHKYAGNARHCIPTCKHFHFFRQPLNYRGGASFQTPNL